MNALVIGSSDAARACAERLREEGMTVSASSDEFPGDRVDVLVTFADTRFERSIEATDEAEFRRTLQANLTVAFKASKACFGLMRKQGRGSIIHVASDAGIRAEHEAAAYSVASAGVIAMSELFAAEGASHGIRANAVCPSPDADVAPIVAWLASEASAPLSGATLRVDGAAGAAMVVDTRA
jgi:NAD(P)-dependent dehydrogenase (short-subunit alcohol dehydrogenase family)